MKEKIILGWLILISLVSLILALRFENERKIIFVTYIITILLMLNECQ